MNIIIIFSIKLVRHKRCIKIRHFKFIFLLNCKSILNPCEPFWCLGLSQQHKIQHECFSKILDHFFMKLEHFSSNLKQSSPEAEIFSYGMFSFINVEDFSHKPRALI
jgi:hypothetical protein